jgi:hypothetical protein
MKSEATRRWASELACTEAAVRQYLLMAELGLPGDVAERQVCSGQRSQECLAFDVPATGRIRQNTLRVRSSLRRAVVAYRASVAINLSIAAARPSGASDASRKLSAAPSGPKLRRVERA